MGAKATWIVLLILPVSSLSAQMLVTIPAGTPLAVTLTQHESLKAGERIRAELLYPIYQDNRLVLPAQTVVMGRVMSLQPDHKKRVQARLSADFTPLSNPVVQFDSIQPAGGPAIPIATTSVSDGAQIYRVVPTHQPAGLISQEVSNVKGIVRDRILSVTAPGKGDRFKQFVYSQLPYHPQRMETGTSWTVELTAPASFASFAVTEPEPKPPTPAPMPRFLDHLTAPPKPLETPPASPASADTAPTYLLRAYLSTPISSATSKAGEAITAIVAEPVLDKAGGIAVPQGSLLTGTVTQARPARRLARAGELHFNFTTLTLPGQQPHSVRATLTGADSGSADALVMNSEGEVKSKPQDKIAVPLLLLALAARPLDSDGGHEHHAFAKNSGASNSLGLIGLIIGTAAQQPNIAAGIGFYGTARSLYGRVFAKGKEISFSRDTRVELQTQATRSSMLQPNPARQ